MQDHIKRKEHEISELREETKETKENEEEIRAFEGALGLEDKGLCTLCIFSQKERKIKNLIEKHTKIHEWNILPTLRE